MSTLRILHLEDSDPDALLVRHTLRREKIACEIQRVATEEGFTRALTESTLDIILADCALPSFDGMSALALAMSLAPDVPFIFVSGAIGETQAIDSLKAGATDYVLKDNLMRLAPAIRRAREEWQERSLRKHAEKSRDRLVTVIEQSSEAVMITDTDGTIEYVNPAFKRITGYTANEAIGKTPRILNSGKHDKHVFERMWHHLDAGKVWSGRLINRRKNGELYHEDAVISAMRESDGNITRYVAVKRDITREVELENQLQQAQKMDAMGGLAGEIAHDFNNLLAIIQTNAELALYDIPGTSECRDNVTEIMDTIEHGKSLVNRLLTFSRRQPVELAEVNVNEVIGHAVKLIKRLMNGSISLATDFADDIAPVEADINQLEQIIINLAINARDAMPNGGTLTFCARNLTVDSETTVHDRKLACGQWVAIDVRDTGDGIPPAIMDRIFEPFFTTKVTGEGNGLGLSSVYGIVKKFGGEISVKSALHEGTTFQIYLPRYRNEESHTFIASEPQP